MTSGSEDRAHWDEAAALEELERLQRGIEEWRRRRNDVQAEFERFVRGFRRTAQEPEIPASVPAESPRLPAPVNVPLSAWAPPTAAATPKVATDPIAAATPTVTSESDLPATPNVVRVLPPGRSVSGSAAMAAKLSAWFAKQSTQRSRVIAGAGVLVVVIGAGALLTRPWQNGPTDPSGSESPSAPASIPRLSQPAVPPTQPAATPADPGPRRSEIVALERVWVRVVVDGNREVERELAAGERVPLRAGSVSVIRAGNAGAVRVTINGEDRGTLGPEGEPITRTLRAPATPAQ
jgi:hypothetical protein